jgi:hypothetical protein
MTYTITSMITFEGYKVWGFQLSNGFRQIPCWDLKRDAIASAKFHIQQQETYR